MKKEPFRRDWLKEAYKIAKGDKSIQMKKDHLKAAIGALEVLSKSESQLRLLMKTAYEEACKKRQAMGLPIPPPPAFMSGPRLMRPPKEPEDGA